MESNNGLQAAAKEHLALLKERHARQERDDHYYVRLASEYGLTVEQITADSGLSVERVTQLLAG